MEISNYIVSFNPFTERHFENKFKKKYRQKWIKTKNTIEFMCAHVDMLLNTNRADLISYTNDYKLVKLDFAVDGTHESPKSSGNRCILFIDERIHCVEVLLIYSKNEIGSPRETQKWKQLVAKQFPPKMQIFK